MDDILGANKYVTYNEYKSFCRKNNIEVNQNFLDELNEKFIQTKLNEYTEYFDNIFKDVGEDIYLDEEQRRIILTDEEYCLINAGAGSGKSTTMAAKVKYLVDKLNIKPQEIIMLSFTKKSSEDLDEKVNDELNLGIPVSTFHSLGMKFIQKFYPYPVKVVGLDEQKSIICSYVKQLFKDKVKLKEIINLFKKYENNNYIAKGFIENYDRFDSFEEYFEDYKNRKYLLESQKEGGIRKYLINRLSLRNSLYTIRGEKVKSIGEVRVANFLYINGIDYSYEKIFEEKVNDDRAYKPDFTIEYQGKNIYVEYFGLSSCYDDKNELNKKEMMKYKRNRKIKEQYQKNHNYDFINLDYITKDESFIETLKAELNARDIEFKRRSDKEIFYRILDNNLNAEFFKFTDLIIKFIDIFKNMLEENDDNVFKKVISDIKREKFKYYYYLSDDILEAECRIKVIEYLKEIYNYYQEYLLQNQMIDYSDMINLSYKQIIKEVKSNYPDLNYKYIIVDEYQDITFQRFLFIKRLIEYFNAKLISVGDDWQAIYAFAGSKIELFNKFNELFLNSKDDMYLSTTYRYGQELVDITSEFILENEEQSTKKIKSLKHLKEPIEIYEYKEFEEYKEVYKLIHKLYKENPKNNILILARTNECLNKLTKSEFFSKGINDVVICKDLPYAKIQGLTMHRSKGLTADQVIVIGLRDKLFPSEGRVSHWIFEYFKLDSINEKIPYAEERRLFYVALTRTRNKVCLIVPDSAKRKSMFINEIETLM